MNTQKAVYNRLFVEEEKTELETHKVELALELGGLKTFSKSLLGQIKSYKRKFETLDDFVRELRNEAGELDKRTDKFYQEVEEITKEGKKIAKDLGIKFEETPIGKEVDKINRSILIGDLDVIKEGLAINLK